MSAPSSPHHPADPRLALRSNYRHWDQERVRWSDTDLVGHANNLTFGAFCETGRCMFMRPYVERDSSDRQMFLPTQLIVNFLGELHWPATVDIGTGVMSIGRTSCRIGQGLFDGDRCVGTSECVVVLIDETTRRPREIPDAVRARFSEYLIGA